MKRGRTFYRYCEIHLKFFKNEILICMFSLMVWFLKYIIYLFVNFLGQISDYTPLLKNCTGEQSTVKILLYTDIIQIDQRL